MTTLAALAAAHKQAQTAAIYNPTTFLIYGQPKVGKTRLAGTIAKMETIKRVYWLDLENGVETLLHAQDVQGQPLLTEDEQAKIEVLTIPDIVKADPALETDQANVGLAAKIVSRIVMAEQPVHFDHNRRRLMTKPTSNSTSLCLSTLSSSDALVIDSGSQLADSMFSLMQEKYPDYAHPMKWWAHFTQTANAFFSYIQVARCTVIMLCHEQSTEADPKKRIPSYTLPTFGSINYSKKVGKYFGNVVRLYTSARYKALNTAVTLQNVQGGNRYNNDIAPITGAALTMQQLITPTTEKQIHALETSAIPTATATATAKVTIPVSVRKPIKK